MNSLQRLEGGQPEKEMSLRNARGMKLVVHTEIEEKAHVLSSHMAEQEDRELSASLGNTAKSGLQ